MIKFLKKENHDSDSLEIISKGISFLIFRFGGLIAGYFFVYLITSNYGAGTYGLVSISFALFLFASIVATMGVDMNLVRYYSNNFEEKSSGLFTRVLLKTVVISILLSGVLYLFKDIIAINLFNKPELKKYIFWVSLSIPCWTIIFLCSGVLRAQKKNKWFAFLHNPGRFALALVAFFILGFYSSSPHLAIIAHFLGVFILALIALYAAYKSFNEISFKSKDNSWVFLRNSIPMMFSATILFLLGWTDTIILGIFESEEVIGVYNVALKIATLTMFSLQAVNSILAPMIAEKYENGEITEMKKLIQFSAKINFTITSLIIVGIIVFQKWILGFFGEEFLTGTIFLFILCAGQGVCAFSGSVGVILQMTGNQKIYQNIVLVSLSINIVLNLILVPIYGAIGAAIATAISVSFWNFYGAYYLKRKLDIQSYFSF